jgi:hypothetical protein
MLESIYAAHFNYTFKFCAPIRMLLFLQIPKPDCSVMLQPLLLALTRQID